MEGFEYDHEVSLVAPSIYLCIYAIDRMCDIAREYDINFTPLMCELINFSNNNSNIVNNFDRVSFYAESKSLAWVILFE